MQFLDSWGTNDQKTLVHLSKSTLETFSQHVQVKDGDCESGGILLGTVHGMHMQVEKATSPTAFDKRFRYFFERLPIGHAKLAIAKWKASKGTVRYLGEWHTHPQDLPVPSMLDRSEWKRLSGMRRDSRDTLAVIVGREQLYAELVAKSGNARVLHPVRNQSTC